MRLNFVSKNQKNSQRALQKYWHGNPYLRLYAAGGPNGLYRFTARTVTAWMFNTSCVNAARCLLILGCDWLMTNHTKWKIFYKSFQFHEKLNITDGNGAATPVGIWSVATFAWVHKTTVFSMLNVDMCDLRQSDVHILNSLSFPLLETVLHCTNDFSCWQTNTAVLTGLVTASYALSFRWIDEWCLLVQTRLYLSLGPLNFCFLKVSLLVSLILNVTRKFLSTIRDS